jgi:hypothetical protein
MTTRIRFRFQRGGEFTARLRPDLSPKTVNAVLAMLPIEATVYHSRWSGREINFPVKSSVAVPREHQTCTVNTGDVIYWQEWEMGEAAREALAVYYGAEVTRDHRGHLLVNVFARVPPQAWTVIEDVGLRIWKEGTEAVTLSAVPEEEAG